MNKDQTSTQENVNTQEVQPMSFWKAIVLFGVPTIMVFASIHLFVPMMERAGIAPLVSFTIGFGTPTVVMFFAALWAYHKVDGLPLTRAAFSRRMWFPKLRVKDLLISVGAFIAMGAAGVALMQVRDWLIGSGVISLPSNIPLLIDPKMNISVERLDRIAGGTLLGRWDIAALYLVGTFFNILGEELWWRGYILPRQVETHGPKSWLIHGAMWALFHAFKWWDIITVLPICFGIAFLSQRLKNNWPSLIIHTLGNLTFVLLILSRVAGA